MHICYFILHSYTPYWKSLYGSLGPSLVVFNIFFRQLFLDPLFWINPILLFCIIGALSALQSWGVILLAFCIVTSFLSASSVPPRLYCSLIRTKNTILFYYSYPTDILLRRNYVSLYHVTWHTVHHFIQLLICREFKTILNHLVNPWT